MASIGVGLLVFGGALAALADHWRTTCGALLVSAIAIGLIHWISQGPIVGIVKLSSIVAAAAVIYLSRTDRVGAGPSSETQSGTMDRLFLLISTAVAVVASFSLASTSPLGGASLLNFASYWAICAAIIVLVTRPSRDRLASALVLLVVGANLVALAMGATAGKADLAISAIVPALLAYAAETSAAHQERNTEAG